MTTAWRGERHVAGPHRPSVVLRVDRWREGIAAVVVGVVALAALGGTARVTPVATTADGHPLSSKGCTDQAQTRIYFGMARASGVVSDADWEAFLAAEVTPRFPAGLTVVQAVGQWQGADRRVAREAARVVEIVHEPTALARQYVHALVTTYKSRYGQESVMVLRTRLEVCFE